MKLILDGELRTVRIGGVTFNLILSDGRFKVYFNKSPVFLYSTCCCILRYYLFYLPMPELPEVEAIRIQLENFLKGHRIVDVLITNNRSFVGDKRNIIGASFLSFRRFGKVLVFDFDNSFSALIHLKLTGQLVYRGPNLKNPPPLSSKVVGGLPGRYTRVIFKLDKDGVLYFNDLRIFGWVKVIKKSEIKSQRIFDGLGYEPPVVRRQELPVLTFEIFKEILKSTKRPIKIVIMDQSKIAGVGNIYANDALWLAEINPKRPANSLIENEQKKLYNSIIKVLENGIKLGGSSENTFVTPDGSEGNYQNFALVYGRDGQKCKRCLTLIEKIQLGGRGTYFCPKCQI